MTKKKGVWFGGWAAEWRHDCLFPETRNGRHDYVRGKGFSFQSDVDGMYMTLEEVEEFIESLQELVKEVKETGV